MRNAKCVCAPDSGKRRLAGLKGLACLVLLLSAPFALAAANNKLLISSSSLTVTGSNPSYGVTFAGNVDGLGASTNSTGATLSTTSSGAWYYGTVTLTASSLTGPGTTANITAFGSSNTQFAGCASSGCPGTALGIVSPGTQVAGPLSNNGTATINVGFFVSNQSGTGFSTTGGTNETVTFVMTKVGGGTLDTVTLVLSFNNQNAVTLALKDTTNATISSVVFGSVNGLGAGSVTPGLTLLTPACGTPCVINPGVIYSYQYSITPTFSSFASNTTGHVSVQVSSNFTHSGFLKLMDSSAASFSSFGAIAVGSNTSISTTATSGSAITRYLGLEVLHKNGSGATFGTGSDSATLTYTVTGQ